MEKKSIFPRRHEANQVSSFSSFNFDLVIEFASEIYMGNSRPKRERGKKRERQSHRFSGSVQIVSKRHRFTVRLTRSAESEGNKLEFVFICRFVGLAGKYEQTRESKSKLRSLRTSRSTKDTSLGETVRDLLL